MRIPLAALPTMLRVAIANMLQYRAEIALWALWGLFSPLVLMALWTAAGASARVPGQFAGRTTGQIMAYLFMTMIVGHLTTAWDVYEMGYQVRTGRLSAALLRPMLPMWDSLASNTAYKLVTLTLLIPTWAIIALILRPQFDTRPRDGLIGLAALVLASLLNFVWGYTVATLSFFVTKMDAAAEFYFGAGMFLGGRIAPIDMLPAVMRDIAVVLPFRWIYSFPSELLAGHLGLRDALMGLGYQLGWLVLGILAFRFCWSRGLKRYSAVGA